MTKGQILSKLRADGHITNEEYKELKFDPLTEEKQIINDATLNIKLSKELYSQLKELSKKKNISLAALVRIICTEYIENKS